MKKNILLFLMLLLVIRAGEGQAQDCYYGDSCCVDQTPFYGKFFAGANFLQNTEISRNKTSYDTGYILSGILGYNWCHGLRLEAEYSYRRNEIKKIDFFVEDSAKNGHYRASSWMANLIWDLPLSSWGCGCWDIQPFIGGGIGYDFQKIHACNDRYVFHQTFNHFAWQLKAGVGYNICCDTDLTVEYIYHQSGCHFYNHAIGIGLIYKFDCR